MRRIIGPDVSFYQDAPNTPQGIDFVRMNQAADFVIIRAGQHLGADQDFRVNWENARAARLPRGSYWFYDSRADPRRQAELWFDLLDGDLGELPLFADIEETYNGPYTGWRFWKDFLDRIKALVGDKEVGIYTAYYYWQSNAPAQANDLEYFHRYPLWIANYGVMQPLVPRPWSQNEWLFWQYTASGDGLYYGVESLEIDLNYFNGDAQAFANRFNVPLPQDPVPPEDPRGNQYRVNAGTLYVREGPGTEYPSIGYLVRNDLVEALDTNPTGSWYRVRRLSDGLTGWSAAAYLVKVTTPPPPPPPPPPGDGDRYRVNVSSLYTREGPGTNFPILGYFVRDDVVEELEANDNRTWLRVRRLSDGLTGWSSATYLTRITTPPPPPPTGRKFRVTASPRLHVREGPGTQYRSLGYVELNEIVTEISVNADQTWRQIQRSDGLTGWSSAQYLAPYTPGGPSEEPPDPSAGDWYQVTSSRLMVRDGPGTSFPAIGSLSKDEAVQSVDFNEDKSWVCLRRIDGLLGWASMEFLRNVGKSPAVVMQRPFNGVVYTREEKTVPRRVVSHILQVDTRVDGFRFLVTPPLRNTVPQLCTRTTSRFLSDHGLQIAINGDGFYYLDPSQYDPQQYCPQDGDPVRLIGYAASRGKIYSQGTSGHPILYINQKNEITFNTPKGKIYNAIGGDQMLVNRGSKVNGLNKTALHPRTAFGVNRNGRYVYLVVVDGRETSEGVTMDELADILLRYGAHTALAFDGGGSSTMVVEGVDGKARVVNNPVEANTPGNERAVANHLGIGLKK